ncbi:hypothetical protein TSOC_004050 [Tetrabaena socialis]|uniref:phytol kinase n=1 Tax=Tetrabaena socialis TaxID=47790 RepID=A0A2J8A9X3_9CHLO|nr:hypothetical protein TSOC_004050 [Tetrabaena socialis]|eukprot:PNH09328.1 hypothetical protein TSOC_004050 [Tetrabaena socialis]
MALPASLREAAKRLPGLAARLAGVPGSGLPLDAAEAMHLEGMVFEVTTAIEEEDFTFGALLSDDRLLLALLRLVAFAVRGSQQRGPALCNVAEGALQASTSLLLLEGATAWGVLAQLGFGRKLLRMDTLQCCSIAFAEAAAMVEAMTAGAGVLPAEAPRVVAGALAGGLLPLWERLLRHAGRNPLSMEAALSTCMLASRANHEGVCRLLAYGEPRQGAALVATWGKLLRKLAVPQLPPPAGEGDTSSISLRTSLAWVLVAGTAGVLTAAPELVAGGARHDPAAAAAAEATAPQLQLARLLSFAMCEWLPPLARLACDGLLASRRAARAGPLDPGVAHQDATPSSSVAVLRWLPALAWRSGAGLGRAAQAAGEGVTAEVPVRASGAASAASGWQPLLLEAVGDEFTARQRQQVKEEHHLYARELAAALSGSCVVEHYARWALRVQLAGPAADAPELDQAAMITSFVMQVQNVIQMADALEDDSAAAPALREVLSGPCVRHLVLSLGLTTLCAADGGPSHGLPEELLFHLPIPGHEDGDLRDEGTEAEPGPQPPRLQLVLNTTDITAVAVPLLEQFRRLVSEQEQAMDADALAAMAEAEAAWWRLAVDVTTHYVQWALPRDLRSLADLLSCEWGPLPTDGVLPAAAPPAVAAALAGGLLPLWERLLRHAGRDQLSEEATLLTCMLARRANLENLGNLLAYGAPRQGAALVATWGKLLRTLAVPQLLSSMGEGGSGSDTPRTMLAWALVACAAGVLTVMLKPVAGVARHDPAAAAAAEATAPQLQLARLLSFAMCEWLPPLARLTCGGVRAMRLAARSGPLHLGAKHRDAILFSSIAVLRWLPGLAWCSRAVLGRALQAAGEGMATENVPAPAASGWRQLLLWEAGAVALLGELLQYTLLASGSADQPTSTAGLNTLVAGCCCVAAACPVEVRQAVLTAAAEAAAAASSGGGRGGVCPGEAGGAVGGGRARGWRRAGAGAGLEVVARARALTSSPAEARALLRTCANPACDNLAGDSEAGLPLRACGRCGGAWYCQKECLAAHWRSGHREACAGRVEAAAGAPGTVESAATSSAP